VVSHGGAGKPEHRPQAIGDIGVAGVVGAGIFPGGYAGPIRSLSQ
jgi:hypothetical protein